MTERKKLTRRPVTHLAVTSTRNGLMPHDVTGKHASGIKTGRPSKYNPSMCDKVIEIGSEGGSKAEMACALNVNRQTLYTWSKAHTELSDTMEMAMVHAEAWWEDNAREAIGILAKAFNGSLWARIMSARFPQTYRVTGRYFRQTWLDSIRHGDTAKTSTPNPVDAARR